VLHITIASGLDITQHLVPTPSLEDYIGELWIEAQRKLVSIPQPSALAIMGEDPDRQVDVRYFDWVTHTYVEEIRPAFRVLEVVPFCG